MTSVHARHVAATTPYALVAVDDGIDDGFTVEFRWANKDLKLLSH